MNGYLRQSTASQSRLIGPFVSDTDFKTAQTGLTIANTDVKLRANGTTLSNKNSGGGTHQVNGMYSLTFDATDTANVGELSFSVSVAGALIVFGTYVVLEEAVYDELFAASALGYVDGATVNVSKINSVSTSSVTTISANVGTTQPINFTGTGASALAKVDVQDFGGTAGTFASGRPEVNTTHLAGTVYASQRDALVDMVWDEAKASHIVTGTTGEALNNLVTGAIPPNGYPADFDLLESFITDYNNGALTATVPAILADAVAHGGSSATITFERMIGASTTANEPCIKVTGNGTGAGVLSTGGLSGPGIKATGAPGISALGIVGQQGMVVQGGTSSGGHGMSILAGSAAGSNGLVLTRGGAGSDDLVLTNSDAPTLSAAVLLAGSITPTVAPNLDASVSSISALIGTPSNLGTGATLAANEADIYGQTLNIDTANTTLAGIEATIGVAGAGLTAITAKTNLIPASPASTTNITGGTITTVTNLTNAPTSGDLTAAMKASVNAEVLDVLGTDTVAELVADPGATPTLLKAVMLVYMALRNQVDVTDNSKVVYNNAGAALLTKALTDDGTTYSEAKMA